jgi:hypothetical protein
MNNNKKDTIFPTDYDRFATSPLFKRECGGWHHPVMFAAAAVTMARQPAW